MPNFYVSEEDARVLQRLLNDYYQQSPATKSRPPAEQAFTLGQDHQAPEVYVAKPYLAVGESAGTATGDDAIIPALTEPSSTAAGSYPVPGKAKCVIYQVIEDEQHSPQLRPICGEANKTECFRWVYNVSPSAISSQYFPVMRDKYGRWLAMVGGGGSQIIRFALVDVTCSTCWAEGEVLSRPPGIGSVMHERDFTTYIYGDPVVVRSVPLFDRALCNILYEPREDLIGRTGYAVLLDGANTAAGCEPELGIGIDIEYTLVRWEILTLCGSWDVCI